MDAADHRIDYLSCAHGTRHDLVHGYSLRKGEASNRVPLFSNPTVPVTPCLAPCDENRYYSATLRIHSVVVIPMIFLKATLNVL